MASSPFQITPDVEIYDPDLTNNFTYSLSNHNDIFEVRASSDGMSFELFTKTKIDIDDETSSAYVVTVKVSDGVNMEEVNVTVTVLDINDNSPMFMNSSFRFMLFLCILYTQCEVEKYSKHTSSNTVHDFLTVG